MLCFPMGMEMPLHSTTQMFRAELEKVSKIIFEQEAMENFVFPDKL